MRQESRHSLDGTSASESLMRLQSHYQPGLKSPPKASESAFKLTYVVVVKKTHFLKDCWTEGSLLAVARHYLFLAMWASPTWQFTSSKPTIESLCWQASDHNLLLLNYESDISSMLLYSIS